MANMSIWEKLYALDRPIRVAIAGAGEFAGEVVSQCAHMRNMQVCAIADLAISKARAAFISAGYAEGDIVDAASASRAIRAVESGKRLVTQDPLLLAQLPVDAICDATGDPAFGAEYACAGIDNGKHVIVINIESDAGIGAILRRRADAAGVVYTEADGDQPSLIKALFDYCTCLGMRVEVAGKWTHHKPWLPGKPSRGRVSEGFSDGSKNQVEMCCVANMTGLMPDVRGMHMPSLALDEILPTLRAVRDGGILGRSGVVETVNCLSADGLTVVEPNLGGGVFAIARGEGEIFRRVVRSKGFIYDEGGARALLYRPYHFVGIETPMSILRAVLYNEPTASPLPVPCADVVAIAKRDLRAGDVLDGIGGQTVRGEMEPRSRALAANALPLVLAQQVTLAHPVKCGDVITYGDLRLRADNLLWKLRAEQDMLR